MGGEGFSPTTIFHLGHNSAHSASLVERHFNTLAADWTKYSNRFPSWRARVTGWHPKGLLVAHLHEHKAAVNRIRVSDEHAIFATASNDGTVKVWDSQKMEGKTTTTRSVLTYSRIGGHAKTLTFCQGSHYLAVASDNGAIQLLAVEASKPPKSPKVQPFQTRFVQLANLILSNFHIFSSHVLIFNECAYFVR